MSNFMSYENAQSVLGEFAEAIKSGGGESWDFATGEATPNTSYISASGTNSWVKWYRFGKIVVVNIKGAANLKSGTSPSNVKFFVYSGLPVPKYDTYAAFPVARQSGIAIQQAMIGSGTTTESSGYAGCLQLKNLSSGYDTAMGQIVYVAK